ncbi:MAG: tetratricopeptide repeat protein, partial [Terriglobales bacterium]
MPVSTTAYEGFMHRRQRLALFLSASFMLCALCAPAQESKPDEQLSAQAQAKLQAAIKEYNAGHTDQAATLFTELVKENDNNGVAHYYLSRRMKKLGQSETAVKELEIAAKLCPPSVMKELAKQVLQSDSTSSGAAAPSGPFGAIGDSIGRFFGAKPGAGNQP